MNEDLPAILGGPPVRPSLPVWPPAAPWVAETFQELVASGKWGRYHGPYGSQLKSDLSRVLDVPHVELVSSGSVAIELALKALKLPAGSEVLLSAYDYKPTFATILQLGYQPVLIDCRADNAQFDESQLDRAVSDKTGAVLVSHLHGGLVDMPTVARWCEDHELPLLEDASQCLGADIHGRLAGTWGDLGVFSFGGTKLLTAGRGGAICTVREDLAQRLKLDLHRGNEVYPLSELQSALLLPQLTRLPEQRELRLRTLSELFPVLRQYGLQPLGPQERPVDCYRLGCWFDPVHWQGMTREQFCAAVRAEGIPLDIGFRGLHLIHARRRFRSVRELPHATRADSSLVAIHHAFVSEPAAVQELEKTFRKILHSADELRQVIL